MTASIPLLLAALAAAPAHDTLEADTRAALAQLVAVDTSHGGETKLLQPLAEELRAAGLSVQLVESEPGRGNLVARYKGNGSKRPLLLIGHVDVVPTDGQPWTVPAFKLTEKDGFLYGRGVNDDKGMCAAMVALALELARDKPVLSRDVIFAFTSGEETGGFPGAQWLAQHHKDLIDAELALNEGGSLRLDEGLAHLQEVGIGEAEKTFEDFHVRVHGKGGHSALPATDADPVVELARALVKVGALRFPMHLLPSAKASLEELARTDASPVRGDLEQVIRTGKVTAQEERQIASDPIANALLRTTCVTTELQGAPQDNVLPTTAEAVVNCRIMPDEKPAQVQAALVQAIGDPKVEVVPSEDFGYGPYSPEQGPVPRAITKVARQMWPGADVHPSFSAGATDSRHLRAVGIAAYGISVSPVSKSDALAGHVAHGPDERRPARWLGDGARFLRAVTYELAR